MNTPAAQQPFLRTGGIIYMEEELLNKIIFTTTGIYIVLGILKK